MSQTAFFTEHPLPVFSHLSSESKRQLEDYLLSGNTAFRQKRLREFFNTIDWIAPGDACDDRLLQKLSPHLRRQVLREIEDYRNQKAVHRAETAEKREQYRLRVFEYFRIKMPPADKALLESLRDYELNLTGRDVNWRHYFTLDSFKKIDAFIRASAEERQAWFAQFRQDVDTYKKNYEKIHRAQYEQACHHTFTFDDWCDLMDDTMPGNSKQTSSSQGSSGASSSSNKVPANSVYQAYQTLQVELHTPPDLVKKQFRKLTLSYHPDLPNGSEEKMKALVNAYDEIKRYWQTSAHAL
jgi:hypothetical protein